MGMVIPGAILSERSGIVNAKQSAEHLGQRQCPVNGFGHCWLQCPWVGPWSCPQCWHNEWEPSRLTLHRAQDQQSIFLLNASHLFPIGRLPLFSSFLPPAHISMAICRANICKFLMHFPFMGSLSWRWVWVGVWLDVFFIVLKGEEDKCFAESVQSVRALSTEHMILVFQKKQQARAPAEGPAPHAGGDVRAPAPLVTLEISFSSLRFSLHPRDWITSLFSI